MLPRKNFVGEIDGQTIYDITKDLNYELGFEGRLDEIEKRLNDEKGNPKEFFQVIFNQEFDENVNTSNVKLILNKKDSLYSETNVSKQLDKLADYLIMQYNKENPSNDKLVYKILSENKLKELQQKETTSNIFDTNDGSLVFVKGEGINYKKEKIQQIYKTDLDDSYCGEILKQYQQTITYCKVIISTFNKLKSIYVKTDGFKYFDLVTDDKMKKNVKELSDLLSEEIIIALGRVAYQCRKVVNGLINDQIQVKDKLKGAIYFKQPLADSEHVDYDKMDFTNPSHVRELLRVHCGEDFDEDLYCLVYDLENIVKKCEFSDVEKKVLHLWRNTGFTQEQIAHSLETSQPNITQTLDRIVDTIIQQYKEGYNDWYYLNVERGIYKKCNFCGEIKLIDKFRVRSDGKGDGYRNECKICEKDKKK